MINLVALPCLCVDVFDGTDELRAGGEALNFAVHASKFEEFNVSILGAVGQDSYAKFIMDSVSDKRIDVSHVRVEEDKGSVTYYNGEKYFVPADEALEIVDTTGCGDSYHAGFVCSHMLIGDIYEAMRVGTEFATETLSHYGGF